MLSSCVMCPAVLSCPYSSGAVRWRPREATFSPTSSSSGSHPSSQTGEQHPSSKMSILSLVDVWPPDQVHQHSLSCDRGASPSLLAGIFPWGGATLLCLHTGRKEHSKPEVSLSNPGWHNPAANDQHHGPHHTLHCGASRPLCSTEVCPLSSPVVTLSSTAWYQSCSRTDWRLSLIDSVALRWVVPESSMWRGASNWASKLKSACQILLHI